MRSSKALLRSRAAAPSRVAVRRYAGSPELEALKRDAAALTKDLEAAFPPPINPDAAREALVNKQAAVYEKFHSTVSSRPQRDTLHSSVYDLPPRQQEAFRLYQASHDGILADMLQKFGADASYGNRRVSAVASQHKAPENAGPIHVAITGAAGAIGYALAFRAASGALFGPKVQVYLHLLELPGAMNALKGVEMELLDCSFPTLAGLELTDSPDRAFTGIDYAFLVGAMPRTKGMERADLLSKNAEIFKVQGKALNGSAKGAETRVLVVGNPANTNALIASHFAPNIPAENFIAMTRLDHNRGLAQIAQQAKVKVSDIDRFVIWGNHSATQFPDVNHTIINDRLATELLDATWVKNTFVPAVQQRGAAIIAARGASSAASAASSAIDQIHDWHYGTYGRWTSAAVVSKGEYGVDKGLFYSYPVVFNQHGQWDVVRNLPITPAAAEAMEKTHKELIAEREAVAAILKE